MTDFNDLTPVYIGAASGAIALVLGLILRRSAAWRAAAIAAFTIGAFSFVWSFAELTRRVIMPNVVESGQAAAERLAVSKLRTLRWAQGIAMERKAFDSDGDGQPEYGLMRELAGLVPAPGARQPVRSLLRMDLTRFVIEGEDAAVCSSGYCFAVWLRGPDDAVTDRAEVAAPPRDADAAERYFLAYAWPQKAGATGLKVYCINQREDIFVRANRAPGIIYEGPSRAPAADACLPAGAQIGDALEGQSRRGDGANWERWRGRRTRLSKASE